MNLIPQYQGEARQGWLGMARLGPARRGAARRGWQRKARQQGHRITSGAPVAIANAILKLMSEEARDESDNEKPNT